MWKKQKEIQSASPSPANFAECRFSVAAGWRERDARGKKRTEQEEISQLHLICFSLTWISIDDITRAHRQRAVVQNLWNSLVALAVFFFYSWKCKMYTWQVHILEAF
jgi:hypothetical protein